MKIEVPEQLAIHHGGQDLLPGGLKFAETFELWGGMRPGMTALDIGCGPGRMALGIGSRFGWDTRYDGFDIKKADIDFCQSEIGAKFPSFRFHHFDLFNDHYSWLNRARSQSNPQAASIWQRLGRIFGLGQGTPEVVDDKARADADFVGQLASATSVRFPADDKTVDFVFATSIYTHFFVDDIRHYLAETARVCRGRSLSSWFLIDERFEQGGKAGTLRFDFPHRAKDGTYFQHEKSPLDAVGHSLESVIAMHEEAGLKVVGVYEGGWTGRANVTKNPLRHSQDVVVAEPI